ncbi:hypothetical protein CSKR_107300 [Clonorchis sinensis]|uniref:Uncharacterized protein n=1 Tax=Clonorchis sinensis TaxID=79923 RepID=A0A3R7H481_CLOSI|nr:hypothetical protein CSKR_107300 [Clonorchis sinensis]
MLWIHLIALVLCVSARPTPDEPTNFSDSEVWGIFYPEDVTRPQQTTTETNLEDSSHDEDDTGDEGEPSRGPCGGAAFFELEEFFGPEDEDADYDAEWSPVWRPSRQPKPIRHPTRPHRPGRGRHHRPSLLEQMMNGDE